MAALTNHASMGQIMQLVQWGCAYRNQNAHRHALFSSVSSGGHARRRDRLALTLLPCLPWHLLPAAFVHGCGSSCHCAAVGNQPRPSPRLQVKCRSNLLPASLGLVYHTALREEDFSSALVGACLGRRASCVGSGHAAWLARAGAEQSICRCLSRLAAGSAHHINMLHRAGLYARDAHKDEVLLARAAWYWLKIMSTLIE